MQATGSRRLRRKTFARSEGCRVRPSPAIPRIQVLKCHPSPLRGRSGAMRSAPWRPAGLGVSVLNLAPSACAGRAFLFACQRGHRAIDNLITPVSGHERLGGPNQGTRDGGSLDWMNAVVRHSVHSNRRTRLSSGSAIVVMNFIGKAQATHGGDSGLSSPVGGLAGSFIFIASSGLRKSQFPQIFLTFL
jgi:hypothetical protein